MNVQAVRKKAKEMGIKANKMNKTELIRAIQRSEDNIECYGTDRVEHCNESECMWRADCAQRNRKLC